MKIRLLAASAFAAVLAIGTLGAAVAPAFAQTPILDDPLDDRSKRRLDNMEKVMRELRAIVFQGRDTGKPVVVQPAETDQLIFSLSRRLDDLEQSLRNANGQNEVLTRDIGLARNDANTARQRADALEQRLATLEKNLSDLQAAQAAAGGMVIDPNAPPPPPGAGPVNAPVNGGLPAATGANANDTFANARRLLTEGDTAGAEAGFADYVTRFANTPRTPEARYWLGKTLSARRANADAADNYLAAVRGWPQTAWAPDALVELSRSLLALNNAAGACQTLAELPRRYPKAPAAITGRAATTRTQAKCG